MSVRLNVLSLTLSLLTLVTISATAADTGVSIIDREMIEHYHFSSVPNAIAMLAGIDMQRTYFKQNITTARGILEENYANKVLVMIDGVPTWNAVTGEAIINRIDIHDVERIEVTKGPASVEFGSNAYAAAINIILRHDPPGTAAAHLGVGTESSDSTGAFASIGSSAVQMMVAVNERDDAGRPRTFVDERSQRDAYREYDRGNDVTVELRANHHMFLFNSAREVESFLGNTPELAGGLGQDLRNRGYLAAYEFTMPVGKTGLEYRATYDWSNRNFSRSANGLTRSNVEGWRLSNTLSAHVEITPALKLDAGAEHESRHSVEYTNYDVPSSRVLENNGMRGLSLTELSVFGRAKYDLNDWRLAGGARYTKNGRSGSNVSADARAEKVLSPSDRIAFMAGQSYRAPSLFELFFHTSTNTVFGNANLVPETSTSYELDYIHTAGAFETKTAVYHALYDDKIFRTRRLPNDPIDRSLIYVNGNRFTANGLELEVRAKLRAATTFATYTLVKGDRGDAVAGTNHYNFRYVPQHAVTGGISTTAGSWSVATSGTWHSSTHGPLASAGPRSSLDAQLGYAQHLAGLAVRHGLVVSNAFDSRQEIPEFVRRNLNSVPSGVGRRIAYMMELGRK